MSDWFYAQAGLQEGPVPFETLRNLAASGQLKPDGLVWNTNMKDWTPASAIPGLFPAAPPPSPSAGSPNPYSTPPSMWDRSQGSAAGFPVTGLSEIEPGSESLGLGECLNRGFQLTKRHFGSLVLIGLVYFGISIALELVLGAMDSALGWDHVVSTTRGGVSFNQNGSLLNNLISQIATLFISLGCTRIGLNLVSGKSFNVGMIFGEGAKLPTAIGASILFYLMVIVGLVLLIVPGIYLALRFGQFQKGIVDRNLGVIDSLKYSSEITRNNRLNLFGLGILSFLIVLAGLIALIVGVFFAIPVVWLADFVAYRWLQYGSQVTQDHPGTETPLLASVGE